MQTEREMYESGMSSREIAKKIGVSAGTVMRRLRASGVHIRTKSEAIQTRISQGGPWATQVWRQQLREEYYCRVGLPVPQYQEEAKLYRQGYSTTEIGKHLGADRAVIARRLHRAGVQLRSPREGIRLAIAQKRLEPGKRGGVYLHNYHERQRLMKQVMYFQPIIEEGVSEYGLSE